MDIQLHYGDITLLKTDAIVNAANSSLLGGGGVDGAIHASAGDQLLQECRSLGGCPTGEARLTKGYNLKSRYVIHTVGPIWKGGNEDESRLLAQCYINSLIIAHKMKLNTISFPNISTGIYGFPKSLAAQIAIQSVLDYGAKHNHPQTVIFCVFDRDNFSIYQKLMSAQKNLP